jgi:RNase P subunit RPR2
MPRMSAAMGEPRTMTEPRITKPAWHRQPCPECQRPLIFNRQPGKHFRPRDYDRKTARWNYEWHAMCKCGFEATMTTPGGLVYGD